MNKVFSFFFKPTIVDSNPEKQWKLNIFYHFVSLFLVFCHLPGTLIHAVFGIPIQALFNLLALPLYMPIFILLKRKHLFFSVNLLLLLLFVLITQALFFTHINDTGYFYITIILICSIFTNKKNTFVWAVVLSITLFGIAAIDDSFTVLPQLVYNHKPFSLITSSNQHFSSAFFGVWVFYFIGSFLPNIFNELLNKLSTENKNLAVEIEKHQKTEKERLRLERELRQTEKMQAIGQLAGGVAHDFNNQLAGILGCADFLREELKDNASLCELTNMIVNSAKRSSHLTAQLLAFARKGKYQSVNVSVHSLLNEVVYILQRSIDKRIVITQVLKAENPIVKGDPAQLENVFLNLALNARDAMPDGGTITFTTTTTVLNEKTCKQFSAFELEAGPYLRVIVEDSGIGIGPQTQSRIFEPFFTTKEKGLGMGLAAAYGIIQNHKGAIRVESKPGKGAVFSLYFPSVSVKDDTEPEPVSVQRGIQKYGSILFVDDEEVIRILTSKVLRRKGYTVTVCSNGKDAVDEYRKSWKTFDCVILDIVMEIMNGMEAYRLMYEINPNIKVLFSSGYSIDEKTRKMVENGSAHFLQKPFENKILVDKVDKIINS